MLTKRYRYSMVLLFVAVMVVFVLSSCESNGSKMRQTTESFFAAHLQGDQFESIFAPAFLMQLPKPKDAPETYRYQGFTDTGAIPSENLYNFFCAVVSPSESKQFYDKDEGMYHIPVSFIKTVLDRYLDNYTFNPDDVKTFIGYNKATDTFDVHGIVYLGNVALTGYSRANIISDDEIEIIYASYSGDDLAKMLYESSVIIKVIDRECYHYTSYSVKYFE